MAIADTRSPATLDKARLLEMYERMVQIRTFEDTASKKFADGKMPGFVHLYAGEEAVAVGICAHLTDKDYITSTHRGHGHCLAKGVDIEGMVAELMGKATGSCKGKGGSMHIADVNKGMLGANGIGSADTCGRTAVSATSSRVPYDRHCAPNLRAELARTRTGWHRGPGNIAEHDAVSAFSRLVTTSVT